MAQAKRCASLRNAGRWTLETSAVLTQRLLIYDVFDGAELAGLDAVLDKAPDHYQMNVLLDWVAERWHAGDGNWFQITQQIIYLALCFSKPDDAFFRLVAPALSEEGGRTTAEQRMGVLTAVLRDWKTLVEGLHQEDQQENSRFISDVIPNELGAPAWLSEFLHGVMTEYLDRSYAARRYWMNKPELFFDAHARDKSILPAPRIYFYPTDPRHAVLELPAAPNPKDFEQFELLGEKRAVPRVMCSSDLSGEGQLSPERWIKVVKSFSGPIALTRDLNWRHPVSGVWMRSMGEFGFDFQD